MKRLGDSPATAARNAVTRSVTKRLRVTLWRHRLALGACALFIAARSLAPLYAPDTGDGAAVVVTSRALTAGSTLSAPDVLVGHLPRSQASNGFVTDVADAVGRRLAVGLPAGSPISPGVFAEPGLLEAVPDGRVVVPVRFSDESIAGLLRPGQRIDVLAGSGGGSNTFEPARTLASGAFVMSTSPEDGDGLLPEAGGDVALLAVTREEASAISGASSWATLSAAWIE